MNNKKSTVTSRRVFLKNSVKTAVITGGALTFPSLIFAESLKNVNLESELDQTLLRVSRDIYPHDNITDWYYWQPIQKLKEQNLTLLSQGTNQLNQLATDKAGAKYIEIAEDMDRESLLREIQTSPFFTTLKSTLMHAIYDNPEIWPLFGYEGSSWEKGGYLNRGFNDLSWL